ncbi:hypothetical protein LY76DRAFT_272551 [Colletotrichum caudatum]|nr:hypothetical protein LY76DRAFT_272551 [Colletotrichum caudatum]
MEMKTETEIDDGEREPHELDWAGPAGSVKSLCLSSEERSKEVGKQVTGSSGRLVTTRGPSMAPGRFNLFQPLYGYVVSTHSVLLRIRRLNFLREETAWGGGGWAKRERKEAKVAHAGRQASRQASRQARHRPQGKEGTSGKRHLASIAAVK